MVARPLRRRARTAWPRAPCRPARSPPSASTPPPAPWSRSTATAAPCAPPCCGWTCAPPRRRRASSPPPTPPCATAPRAATPSGCSPRRSGWRRTSPRPTPAPPDLVEYGDWLVQRLTGRLALNLNTVSERWYYNARTWHWPLDLYDRLGLDTLAQKLPAEILPAGAEAGRLTAEAAAALGLGRHVRVFPGGGDAFVGLLGLNVAGPGKIGLITGSSNVLGAFVAEEFHGPGLFGAFPDAVLPGLWLVEAGQVSTGSVLAWFKRNFAADLPAEAAYRLLDAEAARLPPGSGG